MPTHEEVPLAGELPPSVPVAVELVFSCAMYIKYLTPTVLVKVYVSKTPPTPLFLQTTDDKLSQFPENNDISTLNAPPGLTQIFVTLPSPSK